MFGIDYGDNDTMWGVYDTHLEWLRKFRLFIHCMQDAATSARMNHAVSSYSLSSLFGCGQKG